MWAECLIFFLLLCPQMVVYSLGMTFYWCVDYHLPQNQVPYALSLLSLAQTHFVGVGGSWFLVVGMFLVLMLAVTCFLPAGPAKCRARWFAAEHVWGHGSQADRPAYSVRGLWASPQGLHASSCRTASQAVGRRCLQELSECAFSLVVSPS